MSETSNFANTNESDDFQDLLDNLPGLSPVVPGKRGGGRKATNNIGADVLGIEMLKDLRTNHHVDLFQAGNLQGNVLWAVIDQKSFDRAKQISMNITPSYSQTGVLAVSLARNADGVIFIQWWKAVIVNSVLSFSKILRKGAEYQLCKNPQGNTGIFKIDATTGLPETRNDGGYFSFPYSTLVSFEDYLNAIVEVTEVPVSFPSSEVDTLKGLSEILANVNLNASISTEVEVDFENSEDEEDEVDA